jgi:glycosyltransferase involved in cell wall biosynthesis
MNHSPPKRLLITTDAVGGVWRYCIALAQGLAAHGTRCTLAVLGPAPDARQRDEASAIAGCTLVETGFQLDWVLGSRAALDATITGLIALATSTGATSAHLHAPSLACLRWPIPVAVVAHSCMGTWWHAVRQGPMPPDFAWHAANTADGLAAADVVIAPSAAFGRALRQVHRLGRTIEIIPNGLEDHPPRGVPRQGFVLAAGRLWDPAKNMGVLDRAACLVDFPIRAAGPVRAPQGGDFAARHLDLLGTLPGVFMRAVMARAAIFASPARYEPFGLAVLEAAQLATPLVLADIPTFAELWSDAAVFVPPEDESAWAETLTRLMADSDERARLGACARRRARLYTRDAMVTATAALHDRLALETA